MSYVRSKMINGYGPYYYEVESVREGDKVEQRYIAYLGKNPGSKSQSHSDKLGTTEPTREPLKEEPKKEEEKLKTDEPKPETKEEKDLGTTKGEVKSGYHPEYENVHGKDDHDWVIKRDYFYKDDRKYSGDITLYRSPKVGNRPSGYDKKELGEFMVAGTFKDEDAARKTYPQAFGLGPKK